MDTFLVITPGPYMTVQDKGRTGYQQMGIPVSGALDAFAHRVANLLVGNRQDSAVLEITILGPQLAVLREVDIALTGAEMGLKLNHQPVDSWQCIRVKPGDLLTIDQVSSGCRGYLAVTGGIATPKVMGSRSTYVGAGIGGHKGRPLKKGDILPAGRGALVDAPRHLPRRWTPRYSGDVRLRAIAGPQDDFFDQGLDTLFSSGFMVTAKADRMGYRLQGPSIPHKENVPKSIISEPTMPGGVQVPADMQPIVLLVEQTVGGYTKIATVISTDLSQVAQATPGDTVRFERVTLEQAHQIHMDRENQLREIAMYLTGDAMSNP